MILNFLGIKIKEKIISTKIKIFSFYKDLKIYLTFLKNIQTGSSLPNLKLFYQFLTESCRF